MFIVVANKRNFCSESSSLASLNAAKRLDSQVLSSIERVRPILFMIQSRSIIKKNEYGMRLWQRPVFES